MFDSNFWIIDSNRITISKHIELTTTRKKHDYMLWTFIKLEIPDFNAKPYINEPPRNV